jgi:hypothetical protein
MYDKLIYTVDRTPDYALPLGQSFAAGALPPGALVLGIVLEADHPTGALIHLNDGRWAHIKNGQVLVLPDYVKKLATAKEGVY